MAEHAELESVEREGDDIVLHGHNSSGENFAWRMRRAEFTAIVRARSGEGEDVWDSLEVVFQIHASIEDEYEEGRQEFLDSFDPISLAQRTQPDALRLLTDKLLRELLGEVAGTRGDGDKYGLDDDIMIEIRDARQRVIAEMQNRGLDAPEDARV
ncbi:MAG TPA: hypothetical protein VF221_23610 [Chloroflexota bacterium]